MSNEYTVHLKIEHLPEGEYLATCDDLPGLVAQGRTVSEAIEIAQDVARKLIESYIEHEDKLPGTLKKIAESSERSSRRHINGYSQTSWNINR